MAPIYRASQKGGGEGFELTRITGSIVIFCAEYSNPNLFDLSVVLVVLKTVACRVVGPANLGNENNSYLTQWCSPGMLTRGALQKCPELVGGGGGTISYFGNSKFCWGLF